jgi:hypothetical protein
MSKAQGYQHAAPPEQRQVSQICYCRNLGLAEGDPLLCKQTYS